MRKVLQMVATAAAGAAAIKLSRTLVRRHVAMRRVAPELRSPLVYVFPPIPSSRPPKRRPWLDGLMNRLVIRRGAEPQVFAGQGGHPDVTGYLYDAVGRRRPSGAVLWIHGGGMMLGLAAQNHPTATRLARDLGVVVATLDYRLAPEHPFPAALDDCMTVLRWLHRNAEELGIDPARIAVGGESAGGGLAAVVAQRAHDEGIPVAFQVLICPMLDERTVLRDAGTRGELIWTPANNVAAWEWYLGHPVRQFGSRPYTSAARRHDLTGLPPAWIGVGDIDLFHDEDLDYARRLTEAGVPVQVLVVPGMAHGMDMLPAAPMQAFRDSWTRSLAAHIAREPAPGGSRGGVT